MLSPKERFEIFDKNLGHVLFTKIFENFYSFLRQWFIPRNLSMNSTSPKISERVFKTIDINKFEIARGKNSLNDSWSEIDIQSILKLSLKLKIWEVIFMSYFPRNIL